MIAPKNPSIATRSERTNLMQRRILSFILVLVMITLSFTACAGSDDEDLITPDDYNGSVAPEDDDDDDDDDTDENKEYVPAEGKTEDVVHITSASDLINKLTRKGTFHLDADIDLTGLDYTPFGNYKYPFEGTFYGNGHTITGLKITKSSGTTVGPAEYLLFNYEYAGLFGATKNATITNLTVNNADISLKSDAEYSYVLCGIIAGYMTDTTVTDCTVNGKVHAESEKYQSMSGGISAITDGGKFNNVKVNATITTDASYDHSASGGLTAYAFGGVELLNSTVSGSVSAISTYGVAYAGGIAGYTRHVKAYVCCSEADIYAETKYIAASEGTLGVAFAGGLFGTVDSEKDSQKSMVSRCYTVDGTTVNAVGNSSSAYAGGIVAKTFTATISASYSKSNVSVSSKGMPVYIGSAFAHITETEGITGCFGYGNLTAEQPQDKAYMGGFSGYPYDTVIENCVYNSGAVFTLNGESTEVLTTAMKFAAGQFVWEYLVNPLSLNPEQWNTQTLTPLPYVG